VCCLDLLAGSVLPQQQEMGCQPWVQLLWDEMVQ
jgi:hypothetical protein